MIPFQSLCLIITVSILFPGCNFNKPITPCYLEQSNQPPASVSSSNSQKLITLPENNIPKPSQNQEKKLTAPEPMDSVVATENNTDISMTMNKYVQSEIHRFTKGPDRDFFIESYRRSGWFRANIIKHLRMAGLPESLSWIPLIESGFQTRAFSNSQTSGLWQFTPGTGSKFGLKRNKYIDERLDPNKSTVAAVEYLKKLHQIFGDWKTVLAAYNCGEGRVLRTIRRKNINHLNNFWDLYEHIPSRKSRFVPKFLATVHIVNNLREYGFQDIKPYSPFEYETIEITRQTSLESIVKYINQPLEELTRLNPELKYTILPPGNYSLKIPIGTKKILAPLIDKIPVYSPPQRAIVHHRENATSHTVNRGDSLWDIARRYGTTTTKIQSCNKLKGTGLKVGQILKLPERSTTPKIK